MTFPNDFRGSGLSPPNATPLERVLADLDHARIAAIDLAVIKAVVDPATCPVALLPWLAASVSVDVWEAGWSTATKRAVIAAAPEIHRTRGTRKAVRLALQALGYTAETVEWWEADPPARRGTFHITAFADLDETVSLGELVTLRAAIRRSKPKSRVFTLALGARPPGVVHTAAAARAVLHITVGAEAA